MSHRTVNDVRTVTAGAGGVSDAEVEAALKAYFGDDYPSHNAMPDTIRSAVSSDMRAALLAARRVQPKQDAPNPLSGGKSETICRSRAMEQWEASCKRPDLDERSRVLGAVDAALRQAFALGLLIDVSPWQPIETAPKDGTHLLVKLPGETTPPTVAHWFEPVDEPEQGGWWLSVQQTEGPEIYPTAWRSIEDPRALDAMLVERDAANALIAELTERLATAKFGIEALESDLAKHNAPNRDVAGLIEALKDTLAHLVAATSLLERGGKKAAPSDKMFTQMIRDYEASIKRARALVSRMADGEKEPRRWICPTCQGNGEIVTNWDRYLHGPLDKDGNDAVAECPDCDGTGYCEAAVLS